MYHAFIWFICIEAIGVATIPIAFVVLRRLPDRGIGIVKPLGLLIATYILWIGGLTHVIPNNQAASLIIILVIAGISLFAVWKHFRALIAFLHHNRYYIISIELIFLSFYIFWLIVISQVPAINHTEKPMDFAFLNSALQTTYSPVEDPWLSGYSISYYYFGHMTMAFLSKLTGISSNIAYNLAMALLPALAATGAFSIAYNLIRTYGASLRSAIPYALLAPLLLLMIGNLEGILEFIYAHGWGSHGFWEWVSIKGLEWPTVTTSWFPSDHIWWWRSTRIIDTLVAGHSLDYTITEFPFFSFLLGDMHAHVLSLPFLLVSIAIIFEIFLTPDRFEPSWVVRHPQQTLLTAFSLGALAFINLVDFPVFVGLLLITIFIVSYRQRHGHFFGSIRISLVATLSIVWIAVLMFLPFYLTIDTQVSGILPLQELGTRPIHFVLIWGLFLLLGISFLIAQCKNIKTWNTRNIWAWSAVIAISPFLLWSSLDIYPSIINFQFLDGLTRVGNKLANLTPILTAITVTIFVVLTHSKHSKKFHSSFPLVMLICALYLLMVPELFYLADLFGNRMNTIFKTYYQAWLFFSILSAFGFFYCFEHGRQWSIKNNVRRIWFACWASTIAIIFIISFYYPIGAILDRTDNFSNSATLDGLAFLKDSSPQEYNAIEFLRDNVERGRIVEAIGPDYSEYGRISASTGLPTVLGWPFHERQWRGSNKSYEDRTRDVSNLYTATDPDKLIMLLERYSIRYIFVGIRERTTYSSIQLSRFHSLLTPIFEQKDIVIYENISMVTEPI